MFSVALTQRWILNSLIITTIGACSPEHHQPKPSIALDGRDVAASNAREEALPNRPLILGRPPHLSQHTHSEYKPFTDFLEKTLSHKVSLDVASSYEDVVNQLVEGKIDLALLTPMAYVRARAKRPKLQLIATLIAEGSTKYRGYIVVPTKSTINEIRDLKGSRFTFVDNLSASGYLFPRQLLAGHGIKPERDFSSITFAGSHPQVVSMVLDGRADAGSISSTTYHHMRGQAVQNRLRILGKTDWIPFDALVANPNIPHKTIKLLATALRQLSTRTSEGRSILKGLTTTNGFLPGDDRLYEPVRRAVDAIEQEDAVTPMKSYRQKP